MSPHGGRGPGWPPGGAGSGGRRPRGAMRPRRAGRFIGCFFVALVLFVALVTLLASWVAGTILGVVAPGSGATTPVAVAVVVVLVLGLAAGARAFGGAVTPLAAIASATERLADGESGVRVPVAGPGAVRRLASSFNAMAERLDRSRAERQALLADVTHELRTPLQVIAGSVEAMLDGIHERDEAHLAPLLAETEVMNRLLDDLRTLSLAEAGALPLYREPVDLGRLLTDVVTGHTAAARDAGVTLSREGPAAGPVTEADPVRIREVVANLLVNAIRHTPAGGAVTVAAAASDGWVEITVRDSGEGIAPADLERVFERFDRGGRRADRGGSGLGLTIARDLVAAHGGTIRAESDGAPGRGTVMRVRLPLRD